MKLKKDAQLIDNYNNKILNAIINVKPTKYIEFD